MKSQISEEAMDNNTIVVIKKGEARFFKAGSAFIYDNEIASITGTFKNGDVVRVNDFDGYPLGKGYINQNSKIRLRMLTRNVDEVIDEEFFKNRVVKAWEYRKQVMNSRDDLNCCRVIFGEADALPGITIDKYSDVLVVECLALGMEQFKNVIVDELVKCLHEDGIKIRLVYERSDAKERDKEGLSRYKGVLYSTEPMLSERLGINDYGREKDSPVEPVEITENGVHYMVDVVSGQKTGFFLDQKYNRLAMQRICRPVDGNSRKVLDCFTHMGTFALNAGIAGATDVLGLDISEYAIEQATKNAKLNNLSESVHFKCADVFDELPRLYDAGERYDVVILDPPAFTKSREATKNAIKGYREINIRGMKLVKHGGYFATCSCSHFMTQELFTKTIKEAAKSAHVRLRQIEFRTQCADHPILWNADESYYLKFFIFQVVDEK